MANDFLRNDWLKVAHTRIGTTATDTKDIFNSIPKLFFSGTCLLALLHWRQNIIDILYSYGERPEVAKGTVQNICYLLYSR